MQYESITRKRVSHWLYKAGVYSTNINCVFLPKNKKNEARFSINISIAAMHLQFELLFTANWLKYGFRTSEYIIRRNKY